MPNHTVKSKNGSSGPRARSAKFRVGDRVKVRFGGGRAPARIIEDRGPIGVNGRRLVRIQLLRDLNDLAFEVPAEDLIRA